MAATINLHGFYKSTCTRRVALIAKERNIPYKLITVELGKGEHKGAAYATHQPFGQVPYISVRLSPKLSLQKSDFLMPSAHRVARGWLRAVRVARHRSLPRHARFRPRAGAD